MHRFHPFLLAGLISFALLPAPPLFPAEPDSPDPDVAFLQDHQVPTDNANLLAYLRQRSQYDELLDLDRLIRQLGDPVAGRREDGRRFHITYTGGDGNDVVICAEDNQSPMLPISKYQSPTSVHPPRGNILVTMIV